MATLAELEARYFPSGADAADVYPDNSSVEVLIDGDSYFRAVRTAIDASGDGDVVYLLGWWTEHAYPTFMPRPVPEPADPESKELKVLLAERAAAGVDVRAILWANPNAIDFSTALSLASYEGFGSVVSRNVGSALAMREETVGDSTDPPLRSRVLLDYSGNYCGSHHQKAVYVQAGDEVSAFVGGIDFAPSRWDRPPHDSQTRPVSTGSGEPPELVSWGWHDAGVRVTGPAAVEVLENFRSRWREATSLPDRTYSRNGTTASYNPSATSEPIAEAPDVANAPEPHQSIQVVRSLGDVRTSALLGASTTAWTDPALAEGLHQVRETLRWAITSSNRYVYIEDQAFDAPDSLFPWLVTACQDGVKVIAVTPGVNDPHDGAGDPTVPREMPDQVQSGIVDRLPANQRRNFALFQVDKTTVHSKIVLIDDEFLCIGSANFFDRSMEDTLVGRDSELSVAAVDAGTLIRDTRRRLWCDHLNVDPDDAEVQAQLDPLDSGLGLWRDSWATGAAPSFPRPESKLTLVGP